MKKRKNNSSDTSPEAAVPSRLRVRFGLIMTLLGLLVFLIGVRPAIFGLDRSPVVGFLQVSVFLIGLAMICVGGYVCLNAFWRKDQKTIAADIGMRLVSTGYVIAVFAGMADLFGMGTHAPQKMFFGPWQAYGVQVGQFIIAIGFLLLIPYHRHGIRNQQGE